MLIGKVAMVTGAAGGLGRAFCAALAGAGAAVVATDIDGTGLNTTVSSITRKTGQRVLPLIVDVRSRSSVQEGIEQVESMLGGLDILVNNAGGSLHTPKAIDLIDEDDWDLVLNVNLKGAFLCSQAAIPAMRRRGGGRIVNISSIGGRTASIVTGVPYAAAKAGLIGLTRRMAREVGHENITVNAIAPGTVLSGPRVERLWGELSPEEQARTLAEVPLGRLSTPEEQAEVLLFLAGPGARYITGAVIDVNGGRYMGG